MNIKLTIQEDGLQRWVKDEREGWIPANPEMCIVESLQKAVADLDSVEIISCEKNESGEFAAVEKILLRFPDTVYHDLPPYYDVRIRHKTGRYTEYITLWLPEKWNGRFLGTGGGGFRIDNCWGAELPNMRIASVPLGLINGFAAATTNGGISDTENVDWILNEKTGEREEELIQNFAYGSIHSMTVISKHLIKAVYGEMPQYSYMQGASTGGRQCMAEAQRFPEDFDGIWADCPAINWTKFIVAVAWPYVISKEQKNVLSPEKLEAFRQAVICKCGGEEQYYNMTEKPEFRAEEAIGIRTVDGALTRKDAEVMQAIWDGPRTKSGEFLWYGPRPGAEAWSNEMHYLYSADGEMSLSFITDIWLGKCLKKDLEWNWRTLTREMFEELFRKSVEEFSILATDDPNLQDFKNTGGKLLMTHGLDDEMIFPDGTVDYYERVVKTIGSKEETDGFVKLYLFPGNGHGFSKQAPGFSLASGMTALMNWVENGVAPDEVRGYRVASETFEIVGEKIHRPYEIKE